MKLMYDLLKNPVAVIILVIISLVLFIFFKSLIVGLAFVGFGAYGLYLGTKNKKRDNINTALFFGLMIIGLAVIGFRPFSIIGTYYELPDNALINDFLETPNGQFKTNTFNFGFDCAGWEKGSTDPAKRLSCFLWERQQNTSFSELTSADVFDDAATKVGLAYNGTLKFLHDIDTQHHVIGYYQNMQNQSEGNVFFVKSNVTSFNTNLSSSQINNSSPFTVFGLYSTTTDKKVCIVVRQGLAYASYGKDCVNKPSNTGTAQGTVNAQYLGDVSTSHYLVLELEPTSSHFGNVHAYLLNDDFLVVGYAFLPNIADVVGDNAYNQVFVESWATQPIGVEFDDLSFGFMPEPTEPPTQEPTEPPTQEPSLPPILNSVPVFGLAHYIVIFAIIGFPMGLYFLTKKKKRRRR